MFVADAHCDVLYRKFCGDAVTLRVTPETLRQGGVGAQVFAVFTGEGAGKRFGRVQSMLGILQASGLPVLKGNLPAQPPEAPSAVVSIEGAEAFDGSLENMRAVDQSVRLRMVGLTWNHENALAYPALGGKEEGLKPLGFKFLEEMGRLRMLPDVSHLNERGFWDVCEKSALPPIASHSNCRWLCDTPRNLRKEQAREIIRRGGYIGINFYAGFLREDGRASISDVARHIDALMELGGEACVGFGSDFDGISQSPEGLETSADFPKVLLELERMGYTREQTAAIAGLNLYRVLRLTNRE